jgi:hypothetical protein
VFDSILEFIEMGDDNKKVKHGSKRTNTVGRNRVESPSVSGSVSTKHRSKQQIQARNTGSGSVENNNETSKCSNINKKTARKRSQTPADGKVGQENNEMNQVEETSFISSPSLPSSKYLDKKQDNVLPHSSSSAKASLGDENGLLNMTPCQRGIKSDATIKEGMSENNCENSSSNYCVQNYDEEEDDDDDTPFVMIRRVNNHSNLNKSVKSKANVESGNSPLALLLTDLFRLE